MKYASMAKTSWWAPPEPRATIGFPLETFSIRWFDKLTASGFDAGARPEPVLRIWSANFDHIEVDLPPIIAKGTNPG